MIPVSADLAAAIESPDRVPITRVTVDWDNDGITAIDELSGLDGGDRQESSVSIDRALVGQLPEQARTIEGSAAAQADVTVASGGVDAAGMPLTALETYSPFNPDSPLYGKQRLGRAMTVEIGFETASGPEFVQRFVGTTYDASLNGDSGEASFRALDRRQLLAGPAVVPMVLADFGTKMPGLSATWVIDYLLRSCGVYVTPPQRDECVLFAPMQGSAEPHVGASSLIRRFGDTVPWTIPRFVDGPLGLALDAADGLQLCDYTISPDHPIGGNNGRTLLVELWLQAGAGSNTEVISLYSGDLITRVDIAAGVVRVITRRTPGGTLYTINGPTITGADAWHYLGVWVEHTSSGTNVTFRLDAATSTASAATGSVTGQADYTTAVADQAVVQAVQVTAETSAGNWNNSFTPTAVLERSLLELTATPDIGNQDVWGAINECAAAELATVHFDEQGIFRYWTRKHVPATGLDPVQTVTAETSLMSLNLQSSMSQVYGRVTAASVPIVADDPKMIYTSSEPIFVNYVRFVTLPLATPATNVDRSFTYGVQTNGSWFEASYWPDGGAPVLNPADISVQVWTQSATSITVRIVNNSPWAIYIVKSDGTGGLGIWGQPLVPDTSNVLIAEATDASSISTATLNLGSSAWRQQLDSSQAIVDSLITDVAHPRFVAAGITIPGDPRLQLGDRIKLQDHYGLQIDVPVTITGIADDVSPGDYTQTIAVREALPPWIWGVSRWGHAVWWEPS